jgi:hypothetical protein
MRPNLKSWLLDERPIRTQSAPSTPTASPSTSTRRAPLCDYLISAVYDLATAKPHVDEDARYTVAEYKIYWDGYAHALRMALKVLDLAARRYRLATTSRRREARTARKGAA